MQVRIRIYMYYNNHTSPTIFQQEHVIAELKEYATATPPPSDALTSWRRATRCSSVVFLATLESQHILTKF